MSQQQAQFVHLHVHSAYSLAEGAIRTKELIGLCQEQDMPAAAVTDTNNLFGALEFAMAAKQGGVQPIIGCQLSFGHERHELVLLVQNEQGYKNLSAIVSRAYLEDKEQVEAKASWDDLEIYHDGSYSRIMESGGTGLVLDTTSTDIRLTADNSEVMGKFIKNGAVQLFHDNSQKLSTTSSGVTITGDIAVANGNGIDFSATQDGPQNSPTTDSELFDDYEEGSWTPSYEGAISDPTVSYDSLRFGYYTKIGRHVFIIGRVRTDSVSGGNGDVEITGLPFTESGINGDNYTSGGGVVSDSFGSNPPHSTMVLQNANLFYLILLH